MGESRWVVSDTDRGLLAEIRQVMRERWDDGGGLDSLDVAYWLGRADQLLGEPITPEPLSPEPEIIVEEAPANPPMRWGDNNDEPFHSAELGRIPDTATAPEAVVEPDEDPPEAVEDVASEAADRLAADHPLPRPKAKRQDYEAMVLEALKDGPLGTKEIGARTDIPTGSLYAVLMPLMPSKITRYKSNDGLRFIYQLRAQ
jgi:hypothetical protein